MTVDGDGNFDGDYGHDYGGDGVGDGADGDDNGDGVIVNGDANGDNGDNGDVGDDGDDITITFCSFFLPFLSPYFPRISL